jgi:hypothetical protein
MTPFYARRGTYFAAMLKRAKTGEQPVEPSGPPSRKAIRPPVRPWA